MNSVTITKKSLDTKVKPLIMQAIHEVLRDPDFGLELSERAKKRLRKAIKSGQGKGTPFSEIKKKNY